MMKRYLAFAVMAMVTGPFCSIEKAHADSDLTYYRHIAPEVMEKIQRDRENLIYELTEFDEPITEFFVNGDTEKTYQAPQKKDFYDI